MNREHVLVVQLEDLGRAVAGGDHVAFVANAHGGNAGMEGVRKQADDEVAVGHLLLDGVRVARDVEQRGRRVREAIGQLLHFRLNHRSCNKLSE